MPNKHSGVKSRSVSFWVRLFVLVFLIGVSVAIGCLQTDDAGNESDSILTESMAIEDSKKAFEQSATLPLAYLGDLTLVMPSFCNDVDVETLKAEIRNQGGQVLLAIDQQGLIVRIDESLSARVSANTDMTVFKSFMDSNQNAMCAGKNALLIATWNRILEQVEEGGHVRSVPAEIDFGSPLVNDARVWEVDGKAETGPMNGDVGVMLFMPESDGTGDPSTEDWSLAMFNIVVSEVSAGLTWWADHAGVNGQTLSFTLHTIPYGNANLLTQYEPINRSSEEECLWINEIMARYGYTNGSCQTNVNNYNTAQQATYSMDEFFSIFVVNSLNDADGKFSNDYFGYAYLGGPFAVMTYDNDGWGIASMDVVTSHEVGHIFHACDEYYTEDYTECE